MKKKSDTNRVASTSADIQDENLQKLRAVFPNFVTENTIDFDALKQFFAKNNLLADKEKYGLNWSGKSNAFQAIKTPATGTLVPQKNESVNWDETENIFIEGDNLEVLKLLQKHYREQIKMIYIDPPYNTGKDFIYKDNFTQSVADYYEESGQTEGGIKMTANLSSNGRYHSDWLTMMYPRLFLAKNLLRDDGVIFISIDDNEVANLRLIMDEIFGEENVELYVWNLSDFEESSFTKTASNTVRKEHEYILVAYRSNPKLGRYTEYRFIDRTDFSNPDNDPRGDWMSGNISRNGITSTNGSKYYTIKTPAGVEYTRNWTVDREEFNDLLKDNRIFFSRKGSGVPRLKIFKNEPSSSIQSSIFSGLKTSITGKNEIKELFNTQLFDFPKPTTLLKRIVNLSTVDDDLVLDFFAGSGTTAHAVMDLNAEDGGSRKCISVQLPEVVEENSEAYKAGYRNITEISRERIRRAGKKIIEEKADLLSKRERPLDVGFKAYSLQSSNYRIWQDITEENTIDDLLAQSKLFADNPLVDGYTEENVVYEILLKEGFGLNSPITSGKDNLKTYIVTVDNKKLFITFAKTVTLEQVELLGLNEYDIFVCLDNSLDDTNKNNINRNFNLRVI